ncbi:carbohydrate kinase [Planococcus lenghuensis]|uniref:Carbohydrate kinase n=1 Tax=Planococcus lenghuensis TaxID=2213202 RepID=A0A1Q2L3I0_9BACL|nr:carbohydrate kinase [Planococcus lenghuensis]AQQ54617.1 carbohydrate kinase [Planococcus lenghuensis]
MPEKLNDNEQAVLELIRKDPYVSQQELATAVGLSRPSIANIISGLTRKGYIFGRAYILSGSDPVICVGGANIDQKFHIKDKAQLGTSNPVNVRRTVGGVARNIAENLGRLGMDVSLISASGTDKDWSIIEEASESYMNLDMVTQLMGSSTGSYTAVLDTEGEMIIALANMEIYDAITPELLQQYESLLSRSKSIVADLNCPKDSVQFLCQCARKHQVPIFLISVSGPKMNRLPEDLDGVTWLITNRDESETFFQQEIRNDEDWRKAVDNWLSRGVENVIITNGKEGSMIGNEAEGIFHVPAFTAREVKDVTGAGDAFSSAVIHSWLAGKSLIDIAKAGSANAIKTLESPYTVRQDLSAEQLQKNLEELI